jgi:hypothetical protein
MPRAVDGIIDVIDLLVDESLSKPIVDDYNADRYDRCWHCSRPWHGIVITEKIAEMYGRGVFDESYRVDADDSKILCPGSDFIGPVAQQPRWQGGPVWIGHARTLAPIPLRVAAIWDAHWNEITTGRRRWWRTQLPSDAQIELRREPARSTITLEIGDLSETFDVEDVHFEHEVTANTRVMDVLAEVAPGIGGTWTPLTAPGVTQHPDVHPMHGVYTSYVENVTYSDSRDGRGYTPVNAESQPSAPLVVAGHWVDDGPASHFAVDEWQWERPRTRADILERRRQANAAQHQRLERFNRRLDAR